MDYIEFKFKEQIIAIIKNLTIEEQVDAIAKMKNSWLPEIQKDMLDGYKRCSNCNRYSLSTSFLVHTETITQDETIFRDCGYGEDDTHGMVESIVTYEICPICKTKIQKSKHHLKVLSEYDRYGNKLR